MTAAASIRIEDYLSESDMREIAIDTWRSMCREACNGNAERIIENIGHSVAVAMVSEALGDTADQMIRDKAVKVINELSEFTIFRRPDAWDRGPSSAYTVLMDAVKNNSGLVDKKVREAIHNLTKREALEILKSGKIAIHPAA